jgi:hypothetical protein
MRNVILSSCIVAFAAATSLFGADPFVGTWKLNIERSRTNMKTPPPPPKSLVVTYAPAGEGMKVTSEVTLPDGQTRKVEHIVYYDGKDQPRFTGAPEGDTMSCTRTDGFTEESVQKRDGKVTVTTRRTVSPDGKTMTATSRSEGPGSEKVEIVSVYDRQ